MNLILLSQKKRSCSTNDFDTSIIWCEVEKINEKKPQKLFCKQLSKEDLINLVNMNTCSRT